MKQNGITDETPIAMLTVGQLKEILAIDKILGNLSPVYPPEQIVLTVPEVARLTGYSVATIYKLTSERKIPFYKPEHGGKKLYFNREKILEWMQRHSVESREQACEQIMDKLLKIKI